jgi:hypothetical protein
MRQTVLLKKVNIPNFSGIGIPAVIVGKYQATKVHSLLVQGRQTTQR